MGKGQNTQKNITHKIAKRSDFSPARDHKVVLNKQDSITKTSQACPGQKCFARLTDRLDMIIAFDWDVNPQQKQNKQTKKAYDVHSYKFHASLLCGFMDLSWHIFGF